MARGDRGGKRGAQQARGAGPEAREGRQHESRQLNEAQQAQVAALRTSVPALAAALRLAASQGRDALIAALTPVASAEEQVALEVARALGDVRGASAREAADVAQALGELEPRREVAREARRARIRLRSAGAIASLAIPAQSGPAAAAVAPAAGSPTGGFARPTVIPMGGGQPMSPRLVEAYASRTREQGEVALILGWQEGHDPNFVRGYTFELSFWSEGVKQFALLEPMRRREFLAETVEALREEEMAVVPVTWAQARRLLQEALEVNTWRGTEPDADYKRHRAQVAARLLREPETEDERAEVAAEAERFTREGDRQLIASDIEPDELLVHWIGAWSFGDFALTYDLLAADAALRQRQTRDEYVALRRQWWREADPSGLRVTLVREQEQRASALWVPGAAGTVGLGAKKEMEAFWSLALRDVEAGGQLDELPMATLASRETGRHWYWTGYSLTRDPHWGLWLISRLRDEGAASQALSVEELQRRIAEGHKTVEDITAQQPPAPGSDEATEALRAITGTLTAALHYGDALIVRLPLDETLYRQTMNDARSLGNHERAAALLEKMRGRFADDVRVRFELGVEQYLAAEQYGRQGQVEARAAWLERAVNTMAAVVEAETTAEHLQGLGELLAQQGHYHQAEARLREAIALEPERAMLYSDVADALMGRITGEDVDDPTELSAGERETTAREALAALREALKRDRAIPGLYTRIGAIYDLLQQPEDAVLALEEAVRQDAGDAEAHYALGSLLLGQRQPERAVGPLEMAVQLAPYALAYRLNLAASYGALGRETEAKRELDLVDRIQPGLPQVAELRATLARGGRKR